MMRLAPLLSLAIVILSVTAIAPVLGQAINITVSTDKQSYRPGETVVISGVVTRDGAPYAGKTVGLTIYSPSNALADVRSTQTDAQGRYSFQVPLPPTLPYPSEQAPLWVAGQYVAVVSVEGVTASTRFTLTAGGVVTGRVVDEAGRPVQGATVLVLGSTASTSTGTDGRFSIETGPGSFTLEISKAGYLRALRSVNLSIGETRDLGNITLLSIDYVISQLQAQVANLSAQNQQLAAQLAAIQAQLAALQAQLNSTAAALSALQSQVANLSRSLDSLAAEFRAAQAALTVALGNISSKLDTLSSDLRSSFTSINATLSAITARLGVLDQLSTAVAGLRQDITSLRGDLGGLTSSVNQVSSKVDTLTSRLDTVASSLNNAISSAQSALSSAFSQRIGDVSSKIDSLSSSVSGLTVPIIVAVILALLAFVFALLTFLQVRRAMAAK